MTTPTPRDLAITPRDLAFGRDAPTARWWLGGDPVASAFYDALSATFPRGERFFMDSVRRFRPEASPALQAQIGAFLAQEAMHTREHLVFNGQLAAHGFDLASMEARTKAGIDFALRFSPLEQLGATVALEHFTAILAHALLADPRHLAGAGEEAAALWRWHAMEEIEHKAVAYDTFLAATGHMLPLRRWVMRCATMVIATWLLASTVGGAMADIFRSGGVARPWGRALRFLFERPGILRQALGPYAAYFRPGFHPWRRDDRDLLAPVERALQPA